MPANAGTHAPGSTSNCSMQYLVIVMVVVVVVVLLVLLLLLVVVPTSVPA